MFDIISKFALKGSATKLAMQKTNDMPTPVLENALGLIQLKIKTIANTKTCSTRFRAIFDENLRYTVRIPNIANTKPMIPVGYPNNEGVRLILTISKVMEQNAK